MERTLNPLKESLASNATDTDISRKSSQLFEREGQSVCHYSAFMTIAHEESSNDLSVLVEELGEHTELESIGIVEEFDDEEDEETVGL